MAKTHWKKLTNPNYLGAYSIDDGKDLVLTIDFVRAESVIGTDGKKEDCTVCHFLEKEKPMILNKTNMKMIEKIYETPYIEDWHGKKIKIGSERVKAFGDITDALRIRNAIPRDEAEPDIICEKCGQAIQPMNGMTAKKLSEYTKSKYGSKLCSHCAVSAANSNTAKEVSEDAEK